MFGPVFWGGVAGVAAAVPVVRSEAERFGKWRQRRQERREADARTRGFAVVERSRSSGCLLTESYANAGTGSPIISNTTPLIEFVVTSPASVTVVIGVGAELCDVTGQDRHIGGTVTGWTITPGQSLTHNSPAGSVIGGIVVRARRVEDLAKTG